MATTRTRLKLTNHDDWRRQDYALHDAFQMVLMSLPSTPQLSSTTAGIVADTKILFRLV